MRSFSVAIIFAAVVAAVSGFQPIIGNQQRSDVALNGLFDGFINSMEAGYKGDDSAFQKQKAFDEQKRQAKKAAFEARKAQGYAELKDLDVKQRKFTKLKYEGNDEPEEGEKKKLFGLF